MEISESEYEANKQRDVESAMARAAEAITSVMNQGLGSVESTLNFIPDDKKKDYATAVLTAYIDGINAAQERRTFEYDMFLLSL